MVTAEKAENLLAPPAPAQSERTNFILADKTTGSKEGEVKSATVEVLISKPGSKKPESTKITPP